MSNAIMFGITLHLINYGRTKSSFFAEKYEVSTRTILRYIDDLCSAGVPIISFLGRNGGYEIQSSFFLKNIFLLQHEKEYLITLLNNQNTNISKQILDKFNLNN